MKKSETWVLLSDENNFIWICPSNYAKNKKIIEEFDTFIEAVNAWKFYKIVVDKFNT